MNGGEEKIRVISIKKEFLDPLKSSVIELSSTYEDIYNKGKIDIESKIFTELWKLVKLCSFIHLNVSEISIIEILIRNLLMIQLPFPDEFPRIIPRVTNDKNSLLIQVPQITEIIKNKITLGIPAEQSVTINSLIINPGWVIDLQRNSIVSAITNLQYMIKYYYSAASIQSSNNEVVKQSHIHIDNKVLIESKVLNYILPVLKLYITDETDSNFYKFTLTPVNFLLIHNALNLFNANKRDLEAKETEILLARKAAEKKFAENQKLESEQTKIIQYYQMIIEKFGKNKIDEIDPTKVKNIKELFSKLSAREIHILDTEYAMREKNWQLEQKNKCPHISLMKQAVNASNQELANILNKLERGYIQKYPPKSNDEFIICKICHFNLMCPHTYEIYKAQVAGITSYTNILSKFAIKIPIIEKGVSDTFTYFCKICGEKLLEVNEEESSTNMGLMGDLEDDVRSSVWMELFLASKYLKSQFIIDPRSFANQSVDIIYPIILQIESDFMKKSKLYTDIASGVIDPRIRIYIVIFVWAYILVYLKVNTSTTIQGIPQGAKLSKYLNAILNIVKPNEIESPYQHIFDKLIGEDKIRFSSQEYISDRIVEAYKILNKSDEIKHTELTAKDESKLLLQELVLDPIYLYAAEMYGLSVNFSNLNIKELTSSDNIKKILGINPADLIKQISKQNLTNQINRINLTNRTNRINLFEHLYESKNDATYNLFCQYIKDESISDFNKAPNSKIITVMQKLKKEDTIIQMSVARKALKPWTVYLKESLSYSYTRQPNFPNSYLYDENGIKHKWSNDFPPKCLICSIAITEFHKLDNSKVELVRKNAAKFKMFFGFYETRCPAGGLHNYSETGTCDKCGITTSIVKNPLSEISVATEYYNKYKITIFDIDQNEFPDESFVEPIDKYTTTLYTTVDLLNYSYKFNKIKSLSTLSGISTHTLEAFGRFENRSMSDVETGTNLPFPNISNIIGASAILRLLLIDYYSLKNYYNFSKPPAELKNLLDKFPDSPVAIEKLPQIDGKYIEALYESTTSAVIYQYIIETISTICLTIIESGELGKLFVANELKKLIRSEKLLSKPGPFNMLLFTQEDDFSMGTEDEAPDTSEEAGEDISEVIDEKINEDKFADYDSMNYEEMDYDGYNDEPE